MGKKLLEPKCEHVVDMPGQDELRRGQVVLIEQERVQWEAPLSRSGGEEEVRL